MRLALFEISTVSCSVPLDKVLHVLTEPDVFVLPLLRDCFSGGLIYQRQLVPLLKGRKPEAEEEVVDSPPAFVLVCEAEFGLIGVPADRIIRITKKLIPTLCPGSTLIKKRVKSTIVNIVFWI